MTDAPSAMSDAAWNRYWVCKIQCRRLALTPGWRGMEPGLEPCIAVTLPIGQGIPMPDVPSVRSDAALNRNWDSIFQCRRLALTPY